MWKTTLYNTSKLTVELRDVINGGVELWDFDYPSYYKDDQKKAFEQKVIDHFYFRQIGQETVGRFLHMFQAKVREIMPYYIDMYKSVEIMHGLENPFDNVDVTETFEQESSGNSSTAGNSTDRFSDTPQGSVANLADYLTNASQNESSASGESTGTVKHTLHRKGNQGVNTFAHDIIEFRKSIINVDEMVINELNCLFLGIY